MASIYFQNYYQSCLRDIVQKKFEYVGIVKHNTLHKILKCANNKYETSNL